MRDTIVATVSVQEYFREAVETVLEHHGLSPQEATSAYLVNLLCEYMSRSIGELEQPLGVVMAESQYSDPAERATQLKRVGDDSLYISSFLRERLRRRQLDLAYYYDLGGTAYGLLSELTQRRQAATSVTQVYDELSVAFADLADVLSDVRLRHLPSDQPGELYETWLETRSKLIEARLRGLGMVGGLDPFGEDGN